MSLSFAAADMETVKRTIHYRYNLVKVRSGARKDQVKFSHSCLGAVVSAADTLAWRERDREDQESFFAAAAAAEVTEAVTLCVDVVPQMSGTLELCVHFCSKTLCQVCKM